MSEVCDSVLGVQFFQMVVYQKRVGLMVVFLVLGGDLITIWACAYFIGSCDGLVQSFLQSPDTSDKTINLCPLSSHHSSMSRFHVFYFVFFSFVIATFQNLVAARNGQYIFIEDEKIIGQIVFFFFFSTFYSERLRAQWG